MVTSLFRQIMLDKDSTIEVQKACFPKLKYIDVCIPREKLVGIIGLSDFTKPFQ